MKMYLKHIGAYGGNPATIIEMFVESENTTITESVTNFSDNRVDEDIIQNLREVADELEEHNNKIENLKNE